MKIKRLSALVLCLLMIMSAFPSGVAGVFADDAAQEVDAVITEQEGEGGKDGISDEVRLQSAPKEEASIELYAANDSQADCIASGTLCGRRPRRKG